MAWRSYNLLMDEPRVLVLDARSSSSFSAGHIRGSFCVRLLHARALASSSSSSPLHCLAGPPVWCRNCWWDRHVLLLLPPPYLDRKRKKPSSSSSSSSVVAAAAATPPSCQHPVLTFLKEEGLVRSLHVLENDDSHDGETEDAYTVFAREYPFLITKSVKAYEIKNHPTEVVPGLLYLGDLAHVTDQNCLQNLHISHVITIHTEPLQLPKPFVHTFYELEDSSSADIRQYFEPTYEIIEKAKSEGRRVLIHCGAGVSRSTTLCAAYLMRVKHWCAEDALKFLREQRSKVNPNPGFLAALENYSSVSANHNTCILKSMEDPVIDQTKSLHLDIMKGGQCIGNIPVNGNEISFGCGRDCNVILNHASISRHHASLTYSTEQGEDSSPASTCVQLLDMSTHGTFVNGVRISKNAATMLRIGDVIEFGASSRMYIYCNNCACSTDVGSLRKGVIKKPKV